MIEFDEETRDYYIIWRPIIIGSGKTRRESLEELRGAAYLAIDTLITRELRSVCNEIKT